MSKSSLLKGNKDIFKVLVTESLDKTGVMVSLPVRNYLCDLLQFYIFSDRLFSINSAGKKQLKTLAELYLNSSASGRSLKNGLKELGDTSLYISGFFRESLKKKMVSIDYYINMGKSAYESLSNLPNGGLFEELSERFSDLTFVLLQIKKVSADKDVLSLLDQYMETGSSQLAKALVKQGIQLPFKKKWEQ